MTDREEKVVVTRPLRASAQRAWAFLADTNRWDRLMGLSDAQYRWRDNPDGTRDHIGKTTQYKLPLEWVEPPYEWLEGVFVGGERRMLSGPIRAAGFRAAIEGATVRVEMFLRGEARVAFGLAAMLRPHFRGVIERYLDAMERILARADDDAGSTLPIEVARRLLLERPESALSGPVSAVKMNEVTVRAERLRRDPRVDRAVCDHLITWTTEAPDEVVEAMRPYELARAWKAPRTEVLRAFLHATRAGLLDMRWKVNCPSCRVTASTRETLSDVGSTVHCEACNISYGVDFASQIEAVFRPNPAVRDVTERVFCAGSAWFRPHLYAVVTLGPREARTVRARWAEDLSAVRVAQSTLVAPIERTDTAPRTMRVTVRDDGLAVSLEGHTDGATEFVLVNETARERVVQIEHASGPADAVPGTAMLTFPDYLDLFATEAPAQGVELSIGSMAMLFTDLTGSTALYQRVGDARAFAIIEQHFREMTAVVTRHHGAVIKTMGDAVMASFASTLDAVSAALEMARGTHSAHGEYGIALKVGVHTGPCLAVRANDRVDFFGTTVNLAARLQAKARAGEIVLLTASLEAPEVAAALAGFERRDFVAPLKGITEEQNLVGFAIPGACHEGAGALDEVPSAG